MRTMTMIWNICSAGVASRRENTERGMSMPAITGMSMITMVMATVTTATITVTAATVTAAMTTAATILLTLMSIGE